MKKSGQVTIFIILGVIIVAIAVLIFLFYPQIKSTLGFGEQSPSGYMQNCIEDSLTESIQKVSVQGGSLEPQHYFLYKDQKLEYLCYTEEYFLTCVMQQPMLKSHIEAEIKTNIQKDVGTCLESLKENYRKLGYNVQADEKDFNVELLPKFVVLNLGNSFSLTKGEETQNYETMKISVNSDMYELISIANSILNWEASYGSAETTTYMNYYHNLKVEKIKQSEGTTVYILTNRDSEDKFQFASRSIAWPAGYGEI